MDNVNINIKIDASRFIKSIKNLSIIFNTKMSAIISEYIRVSQKKQQEDIIKRFEDEIKKVKEVSNNIPSMKDSLQSLGIELNEEKINRIRKPVKQKTIKNWEKNRFYE